MVDITTKIILALAELISDMESTESPVGFVILGAVMVLLTFPIKKAWKILRKKEESKKELLRAATGMILTALPMMAYMFIFSASVEEADSLIFIEAFSYRFKVNAEWLLILSLLLFVSVAFAVIRSNRKRFTLFETAVISFSQLILGFLIGFSMTLIIWLFYAAVVFLFIGFMKSRSEYFKPEENLNPVDEGMPEYVCDPETNEYYRVLKGINGEMYVNGKHLRVSNAYKNDYYDSEDRKSVV